MNPVTVISERFAMDDDHFYILATGYDDEVLGCCSYSDRAAYCAVASGIEYFKGIPDVYQVSVVHKDQVTVMRDEGQGWATYLFGVDGTYISEAT